VRSGGEVHLRGPRVALDVQQVVEVGEDGGFDAGHLRAVGQHRGDELVARFGGDAVGTGAEGQQDYCQPPHVR
jgi:hypothetical protein